MVGFVFFEKKRNGVRPWNRSTDEMYIVVEIDNSGYGGEVNQVYYGFTDLEKVAPWLVLRLNEYVKAYEWTSYVPPSPSSLSAEVLAERLKKCYTFVTLWESSDDDDDDGISLRFVLQKLEIVT